MAHASRIGAVVKADLLIRLRRPSTLVSFLLLCFFAYLWVPDPDSGLALMTFAKQRVLYNSPTMAFGTALLGSAFMALFGFYLVSHSLSHDVRTRCGQVIAVTPTANWEYLAGKFVGNVTFLSVLTVGYLLSSIVMQWVRGEAPLELATYLSHYLMLLPPSIVFVSSIALLFESTPRLAGKLGDVLYFFLWSLILGLAVGLGAGPGVNPAMYFDFTGIALVEQGLSSQPGAGSVSIGVSPFDPDLGVKTWAGIVMQPEWILSRVVSVFASLPLLALAALGFHRFDPTKSRSVKARSGTTDLIGSVPRLADRYLVWKLGVTLALGLGFTSVAILKLSVVAPTVAFSLLGGTLLIASAATALGSLTGTPKTFIVLFLSFWYVTLNDGGKTPELDFAGFFGVAGTGVRLFYLGLEITLLLLAQLVHQARAR